MRDIVTYINEGFKLGKNKVKKEKDFVDLGLPSRTLWATSNVGALCGSTAESWYGDYFMWGDPESVTNKMCNWENYKWCTGDGNKLIKYCTSNKTNYWDGNGNPDNKLVLDEEDDMATFNIDYNWKMPTKIQIDELIDRTTNKWVTDYQDISGLNGILFTSKSNDNILFIPAAGFKIYTSFKFIGAQVRIWSSSLCVHTTTDANYLYCSSSLASVSNCYRYFGFSIRGVMN